MSLNAQKTRELSPNVLRRIKLRTRLFVTFLIISLVPVITIGIFFLPSIHPIHEQKG